MKRFRWLIVAFASLVVSVILYGNTIPGAFVYDDQFFVKRSDLHDASIYYKAFTQPYIPTNLKTGGGFYRPIWVISIAANYQVFGDNPASFHVVNIVLYAVVISLVYAVSQRLFGNRLLSVFITIVFAFLPIHTEVVANIKSRDELIALGFQLLAIEVMFSAVEKQINMRLIWVSALLYTLAVLSKESAFVLPAVLVVLYRQRFRSSTRFMVRVFLPYVLSAGAVLLIRYAVLGRYAFLSENAVYILNPLQDASLVTRISTALKIVGIYITKTLIPYHLTASYDFNQIPLIANPFASWESVVGTVLLGVIIVTAFRTTDRVLRVASTWFLLSYFIISKFVVIKGILMAERLMFAPSVAVSICLGYVLYRTYTRNKTISLIASCIMIVAYGSVTVIRNTVWLHPQQFFERMVADSPQSAHAHISLAQGYFDMGRLNDAWIHAEQSYRIYQDHVPTLVLLAKMSYIAQRYQDCVNYTSRAIELDMSWYESRQFDLLCKLKLGRYSEVIDRAQSRLSVAADDDAFRFIAAVALYASDDTRAALDEKISWIRNSTAQERERIIQEFIGNDVQVQR